MRKSEKLLVTWKIPVACLEGSATLVAVTISLEGDGNICGAVTVPLELTVPQLAPAHPGPLSDQRMLVLGRPAETTAA